ncbi:hypothetical protein RFI_23215, partial [Reticulomyxa filosa]
DYDDDLEEKTHEKGEDERKDETIHNGLANNVQENIFMCIYFRSLALMHYYSDWDSLSTTANRSQLSDANPKCVQERSENKVDDSSTPSFGHDFDPVEYGFQKFFTSFMQGAVVSIATADYMLYKAHYKKDFKGCLEIYKKQMKKLIREEQQERQFIWSECCEKRKNKKLLKKIDVNSKLDDKSTINCKQLLLEDQRKFERILDKKSEGTQNFEFYRISEKSRLEVTYAYMLSLQARETPNTTVGDTRSGNDIQSCKGKWNYEASRLFEKWYRVLQHTKNDLKCDLFGLRGSWCLHHFYATHLHYNMKTLSSAKQQYLCALECCPRHIWTLFHYTKLLVQEDFHKNKNLIHQHIHLMKEINSSVDLMKTDFENLCKEIQSMDKKA